MIKAFYFTIVIGIFVGCGGGGTATLDETTAFDIPEIQMDSISHGAKAFFGDKLNNRVVVVDTDNMRLLVNDLYTNHQITYTADKVYGKDKVYVVNRGSDAIDVVDTKSYKLMRTIPLQHHPRSAEAMNREYDLCAVSGMDKAMVSIIDIQTDEVVAVVGNRQKTFPVENVHGGSHACGHPFWLDKNHFALIDRARKKISTYVIYNDSRNKWQAYKLNEITTPSSVHQIIPSKGNYKGEKNIFYATAEGNDEEYPAILMLFLTKQGLFHINDIVLKKEGVSKQVMGLHHGDFHPFKPYIYVGSNDGTLFIVDYSNLELKLVKTISVGKGAGHTVMIPEKKLAIVINHKDRFVSIIDLDTDSKIKDIRVSYLPEDSVGKDMIQAHPKYFVSPDNKYFYAFLTQEGIMYRIDLDRLEVVDTVWVGGQPAQGSFISQKEFKKDSQQNQSVETIDFVAYLPAFNMQKTYLNMISDEIEHEEIERFPNKILYTNNGLDGQIEYQIESDKIYRYQVSPMGEKIYERTYIRYIAPGLSFMFYDYDKKDIEDFELTMIYKKRMKSLDFYGIHYKGDLIQTLLSVNSIDMETKKVLIGQVNRYYKRGIGTVAYQGDLLLMLPYCSEEIYKYKNECVIFTHNKWYTPDLQN
jgi:YVTN family beta-propeller protein